MLKSSRMRSAPRMTKILRNWCHSGRDLGDDLLLAVRCSYNVIECRINFTKKTKNVLLNNIAHLHHPCIGQESKRSGNGSQENKQNVYINFLMSTCSSQLGSKNKDLVFGKESTNVQLRNLTLSVSGRGSQQSYVELSIFKIGSHFGNGYKNREINTRIDH